MVVNGIIGVTINIIFFNNDLVSTKEDCNAKHQETYGWKFKSY
jgi:hypothetical protein